LTIPEIPPDPATDSDAALEDLVPARSSGPFVGVTREHFADLRKSLPKQLTP